MSSKEPHVWIVAAGTGGHIFPGLNVAKELAQKFPKMSFLFFGDSQRLESKIIPAAGHRIFFLFSGKWKGSGIFARLAALCAVFVGALQALLQSFKKKPALLLSVGGYVSVPVAIACLLRGVPFFILEPNIRAGMANRFLSRFAKACFTTPGSDSAEKMKCVTHDYGNPVRKDLLEVEIRPHLKKILVLGGSQGALSLCRWSLELMSFPEFSDGNFELFLQCGDKNYAQAQSMQKEFDVETWTKIQPFINDIPKYLAQHDLVIARAGAMTVAELALAGVPTIFVPYPHAADNHQAVNAKILVEAAAVEMVEESEAGVLNVLKEKILKLSKGEEGYRLRKSLSTEFKKWARTDSAKQIVEKMAELTGL